jgi:biotin synthase
MKSSTIKSEKHYLIISKNTTQMLTLNKILNKNSIDTSMVPAPPETGTVCAIAIRINQANLDDAQKLIEENKLDIKSIVEDKKLKLQGLIDKKLKSHVTSEFLTMLKKIEEGEELTKSEITYLLGTNKEKEIEVIYATSDRIRKEMVGDVVEIRGAIEFSNYCKKNCKYCGINNSNLSVKRYRMTEDEIMEVVYELHKVGIKTVVLQSGEDPRWSTDRLLKLIKRIKNETKMKITLSVGELERDEYRILKEAGADNYLLKIETTNQKLFESLHPDDNLQHRMQCAVWLKELGYLNGSGSLIGIPGQTLEDIAQDILYFKDMGINMIGSGPFLPAKGTLLEDHPHGDIELTLRVTALIRIVCKKVYIPSTTALASIRSDAQTRALQVGANAIMLINTPPKYRSSYKLYDNKNMVDLGSAIEAVKNSGRLMPKYLNL